MIEIDVEETSPRITTTAKSAAKLERLTDWIETQPSLKALLELAHMLEEGSRLELVDDD